MSVELAIYAFLSGLATVLSPCVLPVLPMVLSTSMVAGRLRPLGVVLGLSVTFTIATLGVAAFAQALALPVTWLRTAAIVMLGLFGLSMLIPSWGRAMERTLSPLARLASSGAHRGWLGGGLLVGAGLGLLWAPCAGPIMGSVILLAVSTGVSSAVAATTLVYALGAALPMLAIGYGSRRLGGGIKALRPYSGGIRRAFGGLTVLMCLALLFGLESRLTTLVPAEWNASLTGFERQAVVQKEIDTLETQASSQPAAEPARPQEQPPVLPPATVLANAIQAAPTDIPVPPTLEPGPALKDLGPAPELTGLAQWINSEPLTLEGLRGKVVIVDFWTFGCYNCRNTRPYVRALYDKYHDRGLEILGIHAPEFAYERVPENVEKAAAEQGVTWPIALDPDFKTWRAYKNRYWPAFYFIDALGHIRHTHFGEGNYDYNEKVVQQLLGEANAASR